MDFTKLVVQNYRVFFLNNLLLKTFNGVVQHKLRWVKSTASH